MIIGLTGKSCSGKNYMGQILQRKGFEVWDLDREAEKIRKLKSQEVMNAFGTTDKTELSALIFQDSSKRQLLENILYPALEEKIKSYKYDLVINGATLYRAGFDKLCSFIIYVDAPYEVRLERAKKRDHISEEDFLKREQNQTDIDFRNVQYRCPVRVVNTPSDLEALF